MGSTSTVKNVPGGAGRQTSYILLGNHFFEYAYHGAEFILAVFAMKSPYGDMTDRPYGKDHDRVGYLNVKSISQSHRYACVRQ